jgi:outer membrane protein OmpA-like peptidoglycan-associated protein
MMSFLSNSAKLASVSAFALLMGCAQQSQPPVAVAVPYNPPGTAVLALPATDITWYRVMFVTGSSRIDADGQQAINSVADKMQSNPTLTATLVGMTDTVGGDAANMRLSQQRAAAVRNALLATRKVPAQRIETRWTGERQPNEQTMSNTAAPSNRAVDIGVH